MKLITTEIEIALNPWFYNYNSDSIDIRDSLSTLNDDERDIINYRYFKEFTQSETAKILGMSQVKVSRSEKKCLSKMYNYLSN